MKRRLYYRQFNPNRRPQRNTHSPSGHVNGEYGNSLILTPCPSIKMSSPRTLWFRQPHGDIPERSGVWPAEWSCLPSEEISSAGNF